MHYEIVFKILFRIIEVIEIVDNAMKIFEPLNFWLFHFLFETFQVDENSRQ
jgi:hypothetical protein